MKFHQQQTVEVTLSERNLLSLLAKLYTEGSERTIYTHDDLTNVDGETMKGCLVVKVEPDVAHYSGREYPPGKMHPATEKAVAILKRAGLTL